MRIAMCEGLITSPCGSSLFFLNSLNDTAWYSSWFSIWLRVFFGSHLYQILKHTLSVGPRYLSLSFWEWCSIQSIFRFFVHWFVYKGSDTVNKEPKPGLRLWWSFTQVEMTMGICLFSGGKGDIDVLSGKKPSDEEYATNVVFLNEGPGRLQVFLDRSRGTLGMLGMFSWKVYNSISGPYWPAAQPCSHRGKN